MSAAPVTTTRSVDTVLRAITDLVPFIASRAAETERHRDLLPEVVEALTDTGFHLLARPRHHGGLEAPVHDLMQALALVSSACPSTGWASAIHLTANWVFATFPDEAQDEYFGNSALRAAVSLTPAGRAERRSGGAVVTGTWPWCTGHSAAQWVALTAISLNADGVPEPLLAVIPRAAVSSSDDWYASGMAGSGSDSVTAQDVFVPDHRLYPLAQWVSGSYASLRQQDNPYYRKPLAPMFIGLSGAAPLGIAEGAYQVFLERLPGRSITYTDYADKSQAPITHQQVAEARMTLETARMHIGATARMLGNMPLDASMEERFLCRAHTAQGVRAARACVDELFQASGASVILPDVALQRFQRDVQAVAQHALLFAPSTMETYGRTVLGLAPNTMLV